MTLDELALMYGTDKCSTHHNYCVKYDKLLTPLKDKVKKLFEIGVANGASLRMWRDYFPSAMIYGFDGNTMCKQHEGERIQILLGDLGIQSDLAQVQPLGPFDIIIDDGSHRYEHQIHCFETYWKNVVPGGLYIVEDVGSSYLPNFGVGMTAIDYFKAAVDWVNFYGYATHRMARREDWIIPPLTGQTFYPLDIYSINFFNGFIVLEKRN
jgi:hypothetical protein